MASQLQQTQLPRQHNDQEEDEDDWDDDYDGDDDDIDAEAEEIARRLGEELWADISKASAGGISPSTLISPSVNPDFPIPPTQTISRKVEAAVITMKAILAVIENDPPARSALASTIIPNSDGDNLLATLTQVVTSGSLSKSIALVLSPVLVSLARSDVLFSNLRHSNASSIQLDKGKRKREEADDGQSFQNKILKRPYVPESDLQVQVNEAVRVISQAVVSSPSQPLDPCLVSSIRLPLHQVFLFAVTSSAGGGQDMHALQEISGLIQVIGVLSGIQIGQPPDSQPTHIPPNHVYSWLHSQPPTSSTDIGTAVYPCLVAGCKKVFSRLYNLRAHQRIHAIHRPFHCNFCPASFARNHDLKRHIKVHDKKAWKCGGCLKVFSRRDAIKRHKTGSKTRGPRSEACVNAEVLEVELDDEAGDDLMREERRAKIWSGIATSQADAVTAHLPPLHRHRNLSHMEEGEIQPTTISAIQQIVLSLHGLLQTHVGGALGTSMDQTVLSPTDPAAGQATLASVIARAQLQTMPFEATVSETVDDDLSSASTDPSSSVPDVQVSGGITISSVEPMTPIPSLSMYGLSDEQTKLLEEAIANAASAAQAQAEAEAALEEEDDDDGDYYDEFEYSEDNLDLDQS